MTRHIGIFLAILFASSLTGCNQESNVAEPSAASESTPPSDAPAVEPAAMGVGAAEEMSSQEDTAAEPSMRLASNTASTATGGPSQFREGVNYKRLAQPQPTSVGPGETEVVEVFWYGCGHCFTLDPAVESWKKRDKPSYVKFVRVPAMWNDTLKLHARAFYTAEALGKLEEFHPQIFKAIHVKNDPLNSPERIQEFFTSRGVTADEFRRAFSSFTVETKLQRAEQLNRRYRVESVPMMVIDGKYTTDLSSAGGEQQLFKLVTELAARERGAA